MAETEGIYVLKPNAAETPYYPPAPPAGSGYHRYGKIHRQEKKKIDLTSLSLSVFLVFQEPSGGVNIRDGAVERNGDTKARSKWNALTFAEEYGLKLVGINYFMTQVSK